MILNANQIEQFVELGYCVLHDAFPASVAADIHALVWSMIDDQTKPVVQIEKLFPFDGVLTERVWGAFDDLMGAGRYRRLDRLGWWTISLPGFHAEPWKPPTSGWHIDGRHFHHRIDSPEQGLLPIFNFSDIGPGDGGTALAIGSHLITARILKEAEPDGLDVHELSRRVASEPRARGIVIEANANAGDVFLLHPFLLHAGSPNCGSKVRVICNPCVSLFERMRTPSPVEQAILKGF